MEFTLSRRDPNYVSKAKQVQLLTMQSEEVKDVLKKLEDANIKVPEDIQISSAIYAHKPGDGSAREQAASCQRVLGAGANFAKEYARLLLIINTVFSVWEVNRVMRNRRLII